MCFFHLAVCYCFELCVSYIIKAIESYLVTMDKKDLEAISMDENYDKQGQSILGKDFNENDERNEQAKLHSQTVGSRGPY